MSTGLTRLQMRNEVRAYLMNVDQNQAGWTDAELNAYLNEAAFYIQQLTNSLWDYAVIPVTGNRADYTLPDNAYQLVHSDFDRQFLPQTTEYELDRDTSSAWRGDPTGTPCRFYLKQFNVASLYQVPRTTGNSYVTSGQGLLSDPFNRANENPILSPWIAAGANALPRLINNAASPAGTAIQINVALYGSTVSANDQSVQARLVQLKQNSGYWALVFRSDAAFQNAYYLNLDASPLFGGIGLSTPLNLQKFVGGVLQGPPFHNFGFVVPQVGDVFVVQIIGATISVSQNGVLVGSFTDPSPLTSGRFGMFFQSATVLSAATDIAMDDWAASEFGVANGEVQNFTLPDNVTIDSSFSFTSELGCVTQLINTKGSSINRFEPDPQNRFVNPDYGIVTAFADETQNLSFMYIAHTDTMSEDTQFPQFQESFHPAMVYYTLMRCFSRDGEFQDIELATAWYQAFLDWMDAALQAAAREFPTMVKSAEPYGIGNILNARLQAVGPPSQMIVIGTP